MNSRWKVLCYTNNFYPLFISLLPVAFQLFIFRIITVATVRSVLPLSAKKFHHRIKQLSNISPSIEMSESLLCLSNKIKLQTCKGAWEQRNAKKEKQKRKNKSSWFRLPRIDDGIEPFRQSIGNHLFSVHRMHTSRAHAASSDMT